MLTTHYDNEGRQLSNDGYLGHLDCESLSGGEIPSNFRVDKLGTSLWIPGWDWKDKLRWEQAALLAVSQNFFYAVISGALEVIVDGPGEVYDYVLADRSLGPGGDIREVLRELAVSDPGSEKAVNQTLRYVDTVVSARPVTTYIDGVGRVDLYVSVNDDAGVSKVAFVRDPGLLITDVRKLLGPAAPVLPAFWKPVTAVVVVSPTPGRDWVVRDCESPTHDQISVENIEQTRTDRTRREARKALKTLRDWVKSEIEKHAKPPSRDAVTEATELADFGLTVETSGPDSGSGGGAGNLFRTEPKVRVRGPAHRDTVLTEPLFPAEEEDTESDQESFGEQRSEPEQSEQSSDPSDPNGDQVDHAPDVGSSRDGTDPLPEFRGLKLASAQGLRPMFFPGSAVDAESSHTVSVSVRVPEEVTGVLVLELAAVGENERVYKVGVMSAECVVDGEAHNLVKTRKKGQFKVPVEHKDSSGRVMLRIRVNEPTEDMSYRIRPAGPSQRVVGL